jgi:hypothetical protein
MISRDSINGRLDLRDELQGGLVIDSIVHQIADKTHKLRLQTIDGANDFGGVVRISAIMEIAPQNEPCNRMFC